MRDVLVVVYSRSGTTEVVARALATALGADLDRITPAVSYAGAAGYLRGLWQALRRSGPSIRTRFDPAQFRTVVLCAPVWAGRLPGPVRTYLQEAGASPLLLGVAVSGSGGAQAAFFREMEQISGCAGMPALSLTQREVLTGAYRASLDAFAQTARRARSEAAPARPRADGLPGGGLIA